MKRYSRELPKDIENTSPKVTINYGAYNVGEDEMKNLWDEMNKGLVEPELMTYEFFKEEHRYAFYTTLVPMGLWSRDGITNAIIREKYRQDEMEAITNNMTEIVSEFLATLVTDGIIAATKFLVENIDKEKMAQFKEMQEWRKMAKDVAKSIIKSE